MQAVLKRTVRETLKSSYHSLDRIASSLGNKLNIRLMTSPDSSPPDQTRLNRYHEKVRTTFLNHTPPIEIGDYIGTGGFADVFKATSEYDGTGNFAIKILRPDLLKIHKGSGFNPAEEQMRLKDIKKRFSNESYIQWHLSKSLSKNVAESVVQVYDHGEFGYPDNYRFILMERMGMTLRDCINDKRNFTHDRDVLVYKTILMTKIADIIRNVHHEGIIHRDIKPENILFPYRPATSDTMLYDSPAKRCAKNIHVKLADFGTVRWIKSYTDRYDGVIIGSQFYMSPEQIFTPKMIDARTDIYSFGVACFELLYGYHPKNVNHSTSDLLERLALEKPLMPTPPKDFTVLNNIIYRCMKDINQRFQTMDEVFDELRDFTLNCLRLDDELLHC
ncbi:MAG: protein kinase [Chitinivibrionales bacterium]|nr:protein kinase [Chitinivibrionales bacterium]